METEIIYKLSQKDFQKSISSELVKLKNETVLARYRDRLVSVATVAEIHNVHRDTVIKYAKAKLLPHSTTGKLYKFSLADALEFDFNALRRVG